MDAKLFERPPKMQRPQPCVLPALLEAEPPNAPLRRAAVELQLTGSEIRLLQKGLLALWASQEGVQRFGEARIAALYQRLEEYKLRLEAV